MPTLDAACTRLRHALDLPPGEGHISRADLARVLRGAEQAQRLLPYARHHDDCGHHTRAGSYAGVPMPGSCSCGLDDIREGRFAGEPPTEVAAWAVRQAARR